MGAPKLEYLEIIGEARVVQWYKAGNHRKYLVLSERWFDQTLALPSNRDLNHWIDGWTWAIFEHDGHLRMTWTGRDDLALIVSWS